MRNPTSLGWGMKQFVVLCLGLWAVASLAGERVFTCNATDEMDRPYQLEFNVETGVVKKRSSRSLTWEVLNSNTRKCGHIVTKNTVCNSQATSTSLVVTCATARNGEYNTELVINQAGNGLGYFVCGDYDGQDLNLSRCQLKSQ